MVPVVFRADVVAFVFGDGVVFAGWGVVGAVAGHYTCVSFVEFGMLTVGGGGRRGCACGVESGEEEDWEGGCEGVEEHFRGVCMCTLYNVGFIVF